MLSNNSSSMLNRTTFKSNKQAHHEYLHSIAVMIMSYTYRHWESWGDSKDPGTRRLAIKAKTYGLIAYDRFMEKH